MCRAAKTFVDVARASESLVASTMDFELKQREFDVAEAAMTKVSEELKLAEESLKYAPRRRACLDNSWGARCLSSAGRRLNGSSVRVFSCLVLCVLCRVFRTEVKKAKDAVSMCRDRYQQVRGRRPCSAGRRLGDVPRRRGGGSGVMVSRSPLASVLA